MTPAEWLTSLGHNSKPILVTIGNQTWPGASYELNGEVAYYLTGPLPKGWKNGVCFRFEGDKRDWFVACYSTLHAVQLHPEYHPYGISFVLKPWDAPGKIDEFEVRPYVRVQADVRTP